jgi:acyl transferase domain-containing protein
MRVSINNFGFGGSNAHAIVERHTDNIVVNGAQVLEAPCNRLYILSAKCKTSLKGNILAFRSYVENVNPDCESDFMRDLSTTLCDHRTVFKHSHAFVASTRQQMIDKLASTLPASGPSAEPPIFIFTGQGAQWARMGIALMRNNDYSAIMHEADRYLRSLGASWSLVGA